MRRRDVPSIVRRTSALAPAPAFSRSFRERRFGEQMGARHRDGIFQRDPHYLGRIDKQVDRMHELAPNLNRAACCAIWHS
jgi:hypothetical protein